MILKEIPESYWSGTGTVNCKVEHKGHTAFMFKDGNTVKGFMGSSMYHDFENSIRLISVYGRDYYVEISL